MLVFLNMESQENFTIYFDGLTYSNITFQAGGYLAYFTQQLANPVIMTDLVMTDVFNGMFFIESANKNKLKLETKVVVENGHFIQVNSNRNTIFLLHEGANLVIK